MRFRSAVLCKAESPSSSTALIDVFVAAGPVNTLMNDLERGMFTVVGVFVMIGRGCADNTSG